jgi:hypothetical protein
VTTIKTIGSLRTFASRRSNSLGSSLAAIETAGRQQSAAVIHRINFRIIVRFLLSTVYAKFYYAFIDHSAGNDQLRLAHQGELRRFFDAVASSREGQHLPRSGREVQRRRWGRGLR